MRLAGKFVSIQIPSLAEFPSLLPLRNGGHIKPPLHHDYLSLKKKYGKEQAMMLIRFRLQHISELLSVAAEEDAIKESQCREVESLDVYFDRHLFDQAKKQLLGWKADMPVESQDFSWEEGEEAAQVRDNLQRYRARLTALY